MAESYHGASLSRAAMRGWKPAKGDADDVANMDLPALRENASDLVRNAPLAGGAINAMTTNVVGTGLSLQSSIDADYLGMTEDEADAWQARAEREFRLWGESTDCDTTRAQNFYGLQNLAFRSAMERGDVFALTPSIKREGPYQLTIQLIEADRVCNQNWKQDTDTMRAGVELNPETGESVAVHVCSIHPGNMRSRGGARWQRFPMRGSTGRRNVIHLFERKRPGQTRGIPVLAPVIEPLKQLGRYTDAELQAAVVSGAFAVFVKMDPEAFNGIFDNQDVWAEGAAKNYVNLGTSWDGTYGGGNLNDPGKAINLLPGESVESVNPGRPNSNFDPFFMAIAKQIGVLLEIPVEVLLKQYTASYTAARSAMLDAWKMFRCKRDWMSTYFCDPIYHLFLDEAVAMGRLAAPGYFADPMIRKAYQGAVWIGDGPGSLDPYKEAMAAEKRIDLEISTRASESIQHDGVPWEVKHRQRAKEEAAARADGTNASDKVAPAAQPIPQTPAAKRNVNGSDLETA